MKDLLIIRHVILLSAGLAIMALDHYIGLPTMAAITLLVLWASFKVYYFVRFSFKQMEEVEERGWFLTFLRMMSIIVSLVLVSFAADYATLFQLDPNSFKGINEPELLALVFWQFLYFSIATFATVGFGDISPNSRPAELLVALEILLSFVAIIFVLSNSRDIKKSLDVLNEDEDSRHKQAKKEKKEQDEDAV